MKRIFKKSFCFTIEYSFIKNPLYEVALNSYLTENYDKSKYYINKLKDSYRCEGRSTSREYIELLRKDINLFKNTQYFSDNIKSIEEIDDVTYNLSKGDFFQMEEDIINNISYMINYHPNESINYISKTNEFFPEIYNPIFNFYKGTAYLLEGSNILKGIELLEKNLIHIDDKNLISYYYNNIAIGKYWYLKKEIFELNQKDYTLEEYDKVSRKIYNILQMLKKSIGLLESLDENLEINSDTSQYKNNLFEFDNDLIIKFNELKLNNNPDINRTDEFKKIRHSILKYFLSPKPELYKGLTKEFEVIFSKFQKELFIENQMSLNILFNLSQIYYDFNDYEKSITSLSLTMPHLKNNSLLKTDFLRNMSFLFLINKKFYNKENEGFQKIISEINEYSPSFSISLIYKYYSDYLKEVNSNNPMIQKYNSNFEKINIRIDQNKPHHFSYRKNMLIFPKD